MDEQNHKQSDDWVWRSTILSSKWILDWFDSVEVFGLRFVIIINEESILILFNELRVYILFFVRCCYRDSISSSISFVDFWVISYSDWSLGSDDFIE